MRLLSMGILCVVLLVLSACGVGSNAETSSTPTAEPSLKRGPIVDRRKPPRIIATLGRPPVSLVVRDIARGTGAAIPAKGEVEIHTNFVAVSYRTGRVFERKWAPRGAFNPGFGPGLVLEGWERGLVGMRVGGRRELRVPSRMAYGTGAIAYIIDLLGVSRPL